MVNKFMWEVDRSEQTVQAFRQDPAAFVRRWESVAAVPPFPEGGRLTDVERRAVVTLDFAALYGLGAHPFLLWQFLRSVLVPEQMTHDELVAAFAAGVAGLGYPDFAT
jgi:hypothetical protein